MGWLFSHTTRAELIASLTQSQESDISYREMLKYALRGNILWSVVRLTVKQDTPGLAAGESTIFIGCDLLQKSGGLWGCKSLCEDDRPFYYSCPLSYLTLAPVRAPAWRDEVLAWHLARRARA